MDRWTDGPMDRWTDAPIRQGAPCIRAPLVAHEPAAGYRDAAARRRISPAIARTRAASFAPATSLSTCRASAFSAVARAAPVFASAASRAEEIAAVRADASPPFRTSWSRYDRTTANAGGHVIFGWLCGL